MRFNEEKKHDIIIYLLEKVAQNDPHVSMSVSDTFSVNQNTVHSYINELVGKNIIYRVKRGRYALVKHI